MSPPPITSLCNYPFALGPLELPSPPFVWEAAHAYVAGDKVLSASVGELYECVTGGTSAAPPPTHLTGNAPDGGGVVWKHLPRPALPALPPLPIPNIPACPLDELF